MTLYNHPDIVCDWPGCYSRSSELHIGEYKAAPLRRALADKHGWSVELGSDFCGHHPALADHTPTLKKVVEGLSTGYRATCSCGWTDKDTREHPWPLERSIAIFWWRRHLPEEDHATCMRLFRQAKEAVEV